MKKVFILVLTILVMVGMANAQAADGTRTTATAAANTTYYNVDGGVIGSHIKHGGCMLCHAPHSANSNISSAAVTPVGGKFNINEFAPDYTGSTTISSIYTGNSGGAVRGDIYLWGTALTAQTYTTWDGSTINAAGVTKNNAVVHTLLCMSCHDNANSSYGMGRGYGYPPNTNPKIGTEFGTTNTVVDSYGDNIGLSTISNPLGPAVWNSGSSLQNSHPVHAQYSGWKINTDGTFVDKTFALTSTLTGHPAKLWMEGSVAYVECTSCHDPHRETQFAYWDGSKYSMGGPNSTVFYLRGPYGDPSAAGNGNMNANFCRSCHYSKSQAYADNNGQPQ